MRVIIEEKRKRYTIPLPFFVLRLAGWIICRKWFWRLINKKTKKFTFPIPLVDKQIILPVLSELKEFKDVTIVDVKDKDGNKVIIQL